MVGLLAILSATLSLASYTSKLNEVLIATGLNYNKPDCTTQIIPSGQGLEFLLLDLFNLSLYCKYTTASSTIQQFIQRPDLVSQTAIALKRSGLLQKFSEKPAQIGNFLRGFISRLSPYVLNFKAPKTESPLKANGTYPLAIFHGLGDCCCFPGMGDFTSFMSSQMGTYTKCVQIGDGPITSWLQNFDTQVEKACESLRSNPSFQNGLHTMGLSHGGLVARSIAERCGLQVHTVVTFGGPHMGVATIPDCKSGFVCNIVNDVTDLGIYDSYVQNHIGPAGYYKDQYDYDTYLDACVFLPIANNEKTLNTTKRQGLQSVDNLVLVKFTEDTVVDPPESEWFGYYQLKSKTVVPFNETTDYQNNLLGLKQLEAASKIHFVPIKGNHLEFTYDDVKKYILPYLTNQVINVFA